MNDSIHRQQENQCTTKTQMSLSLETTHGGANASRDQTGSDNERSQRRHLLVKMCVCGQVIRDVCVGRRRDSRNGYYLE